MCEVQIAKNTGTVRLTTDLSQATTQDLSDWSRAGTAWYLLPVTLIIKAAIHNLDAAKAEYAEVWN